MANCTVGSATVLDRALATRIRWTLEAGRLDRYEPNICQPGDGRFSAASTTPV
jgi:hypothetical protein